MSTIEVKINYYFFVRFHFDKLLIDKLSSMLGLSQANFRNVMEEEANEQNRTEMNGNGK